ncbi:MAG: hypothetical protein ACOX8T_10900, partial [Bacillota bacterium]
MNVEGFLNALTHDLSYRGQVVRHQVFPCRQPVFGRLAPPLPAALAQALEALGVKELYSHQATAVQQVRAGKNIVVVTATASG